MPPIKRHPPLKTVYSAACKEIIKGTMAYPSGLCPAPSSPGDVRDSPIHVPKSTCVYPDTSAVARAAHTPRHKSHLLGTMRACLAETFARLKVAFPVEAVAAHKGAILAVGPIATLGFTPRKGPTGAGYRTGTRGKSTPRELAGPGSLGQGLDSPDKYTGVLESRCHCEVPPCPECRGGGDTVTGSL